MGKKLSEMSLEELWQLFPIILTEHKDVWSAWFEEEKEILTSLLPKNAEIHHIGSTAIKDIWAKPIIDILIEVPSEDDLLTAKDILVNNGYICMSQDKTRISLNKGYTENGFADRVFHIHLKIDGDNVEIAFRDLLNSDEKLAKQYEKLKLSLWEQYEHDRDGYTKAKTKFIEKLGLSRKM